MVSSQATVSNNNPALDQRPVTRLRGVGDQVAARLQKLGIRTVQDVLFHLPLRYEDRTRITPIGQLRPGLAAVVEAEVELSEVAYRGRRNLLCRISDGTGSLMLRFFHFSASQAEGLRRGARVRVYGEPRRGAVMLEMIHPEYRVLHDTATEVEEHLTAIYPLTEGITQGRLRGLSTQALTQLKSPMAVTDLLPEPLIESLALPGLVESLKFVHRPPPDAPIDEMMQFRHPAQRRLAFEELLAQHISLRQLRHAAERGQAHALPVNSALADEFVRALPFDLTRAQQKVADVIGRDLSQSHPMMRLIQGDVGSGKTVVAAQAALHAIQAGHQAAIMAPTELLAEQHFKNFDRWFTPLGVRVSWLAGKQKASVRNAALTEIADGGAQLVVGTHALFQDEVQFADLALVVVDEQHRFGVQQRLALSEKRTDALMPHQLIMTATPIPRTLAMTAYADLDVSVIDELPPGRTPVQTVVLPDNRRPDIIARIKTACAAGRQAYWVCPLIEESELLEIEAAQATWERLREALPDLEVGLIHGRMKAVDKDRVMAAFKSGKIQLLVATTVIEVGVDVPNASLMVIENAERLGLAQLHQLRGRVGRGDAQSSCVLMYKSPLGQLARKRLAVMRETTDGFEIARQDLQLRGPGELLGTRQTGLMAMRIADLVRDADLLPQVQQAAEELLRDHPALVEPLLQRWLADGLRYARA